MERPLSLAVAGGRTGAERVVDRYVIPTAVQTATASVHEVCEITPGGDLAGNEAWHHDPEAGGLIFRIVTLPPVPPRLRDRPLHASDTVDVGHILSGAITLVLPGGVEEDLVVSDSFVLRGIEHAWRNDADEPCVMAVVLVKPVAARSRP